MLAFEPDNDSSDSADCEEEDDYEILDNINIEN